MKQKALILDFGGGISRTLFETHDVTERALGLKPGTLQGRVYVDGQMEKFESAATIRLPSSHFDVTNPKSIFTNALKAVGLSVHAGDENA